MQVQIQALLAATGGAGSAKRGAMGSNTGSHMEVAKPAIFNGETGKVGGFVIAYSVVATTHHSRTNDLTTSKALQWAIK